MTKEEAIKIIKSECYIADLLDLDRTQMVNTALDMAIKALEQGTFERVYKDTEELWENAYKHGYHDGLYDAIKAIEEKAERQEGDDNDK